MKLYFTAQDIVTIVPTINVFWDRNYRTGNLYNIDVYIPWGMWCVGICWTNKNE